MKRRIVILLVFSISALELFAQKENITKALRYYQAGKLDTAKVVIDEAIIHPETSNDFIAWYYRGFIYKDIYNQLEKGNKKSPARITSIQSFKKFLELDTMSQFNESAVISYVYLINTIYNDAVTSLNESSSNINSNAYLLALENYKIYKEHALAIEPNKDFKEIDIQFYLYLGSIYMQMYESAPDKNKDFFNTARDTYSSVLKLDSNNYNANYNMGILYYNSAVNIIKSMDNEVDLITLDLIQNETVELFRYALPYMQKAFVLNPKRVETLTGLAGIYFSLNEFEKSEEINKQLENLKKND